MNRFFLIIVCSLLSFYTDTFAQEKKPTLMILPSDNWCEARYYMNSYDNAGVKVKTPDYGQAFMEDSELPFVISKIGEQLISIGYSIKDAEMETKAVYARLAEDNLMSSSTSGAMIAESPLDMIKRHAKMDILIQLWWDVNTSSNGKSVSFILEAFDTYTSKRIATSSGSIPFTNEPIPILLDKAIKSNIKPFDKQMDSYYKEMRKNGREIILNIRIWENWENNLESEFDGEELIEIIQKWMREHTIRGVFNLSDATEKYAQFEQVRIPLVDSYGNPMDARSFVSGLRKYLALPPYNIQSKILLRGLGEANLVLGEK